MARPWSCEKRFWISPRRLQSEPVDPWNPWSELKVAIYCRERPRGPHPRPRVTRGLTSGASRAMRKTFCSAPGSGTAPTRGPVEPVVGARTRTRMQGEAMRTISSSTGNPWTYQWCKPCHAKNLLLCAREQNNPNPWTRGTRGRRPNSQHNAGRGQEGHILAHG